MPIASGSTPSPKRSLDIESLAALRRGTRELKEDHANGASDFALTAIVILGETAKEIKIANVDLSPVEFWHILIACARKLVQARPSMSAGIINAMINVLGSLREELASSAFNSSGVSLENFIHKLDYKLSSESEFISNYRQVIGRHFADWVESDKSGFAGQPIRILTLSSSSTLMACFQELHKLRSQTKTEIGILESRPLCEGARFAVELANSIQKDGKSSWCIEIAPDSHVALLARADILLLGADQIASNGAVSNKVGSLPAIICARAQNNKAKIVVAAESAKTSNQWQSQTEEADREEVMRMWGDEVERGVKALPLRVRNVYFEWIEPKYIDKYICELGDINEEKILEMATKKDKIQKQMFGEIENMGYDEENGAETYEADTEVTIS